MLDQIRIIATFALALAAGNATFFFFLKGQKYRVDLTLNGKSNSPHLPAITQLANAALGAMLAGAATANARVGSNDWGITVTAA